MKTAQWPLSDIINMLPFQGNISTLIRLPLSSKVQEMRSKGPQMSLDGLPIWKIAGRHVNAEPQPCFNWFLVSTVKLRSTEWIQGH